MARTPYKDCGKFFLEQGRKYFLKGCAILCIARFKIQDSNQKIRRSFVDVGRSGIHAEEFVFRRIGKEEKTKSW
jgi:hypothetical protein